MDALRITGLSHNFGSVQALSDVSLTVPRGSFTALLGVNGAGKTTLFSLVTRLYSNVSGSIEVAGHDLRRQPAQAMARLGVVFQSRAAQLKTEFFSSVLEASIRIRRVTWRIKAAGNFLFCLETY